MEDRPYWDRGRAGIEQFLKDHLESDCAGNQFCTLLNLSEATVDYDSSHLRHDASFAELQQPKKSTSLKGRTRALLASLNTYGEYEDDDDESQGWVESDNFSEQEGLEGGD